MKKQIRISFILIIALSLTVSSNISAAAEKLPYACVIRVTERNWVNAFKFANTLLYADYPVYWAASRFNIGADIFEAGDFVVPVADTRDPKKTVAFVSTVGEELNLDVKSYDTQFDAILYPLRPIKVAICAHNGTMWGYYVEVVRGLGFKADLITELDIKAGLLTLDRYDAFCLPGGSTAWMMVTLGEDGCK
ncbi:MAG: hypothetical protein QXK52_07370, partial [Candidatus Bathyarchaeia archaeon]